MSIVDWIFPKRCVGCGREGKYICTKCEETVQTKGLSLRYEGVVRKMIKEIKYRGTYDMVKELIDLWEKKTGYKPKLEGDEIVTSVPISELKKRKRGFNQAELLGRELASRWSIKYCEMLVRVRETKPMYGLSKSERRENIRDAFKINVHKAQMTNVHKLILADDVWTTGSTIKECTRILKDSNIKTVWPITIAR